MEVIKKETVSQLVSVIKSLESKVVSLEEQVNSSQQDYSETVLYIYTSGTFFKRKSNIQEGVHTGR